MKLGKLLYLTPLLLAIGCTPVEQAARNAAAALNGAIAAAQAQYQGSCSGPVSAQVNPRVCVLIDQAVAAQNALVTAAETYCGFSPAAPPADPTSACVPVKSAKQGLINATVNANTFILELQATLAPTVGAPGQEISTKSVHVSGNTIHDAGNFTLGGK